MNILFVTEFEPSPTCGGIDRVVALLSEIFRKRMNVNCFLTYIKQNRQKYDTNVYVDVIQKPSLQELSDFIISNSIDLIIDHILSKESISFYIHNLKQICTENKIRHILVYHTMPGFETIGLLPVNIPNTLQNIIFRREYKKITDNVDKVILLSQSYEKDFRRISGNYTIPINVIPNPANIGTHQKFCKEKIVLTVARLDEKTKRISHMIKIWKLINTKDWKLIIVGDGPDKTKYIKLAKDSNNIIFTGRQVPDEYYKKASIFLMTSNFEGFPMTLIECQSYGCVPIVYDSFPSVRDLVTDGINGRIISNNNIKEFANVLEELMTNESERNKLSSETFNHILPYNEDNIVRKWKYEIDKYHETV